MSELRLDRTDYNRRIRSRCEVWILHVDDRITKHFYNGKSGIKENKNKCDHLTRLLLQLSLAY